MSPCADKVLMLHGLVDGELDAANVLAIEAHVRTCPGCAEELARLKALGRLLRAPGVAYPAPPALASRVEAAIQDEGRSRARPRLRSTAPWAISGAASALAAGLALVMLQPGGHQRAIEGEVIAGHIRSLQATHLTDLSAADPQEVQRWFGGDFDFTPPAPNLASAGFPLAGGRLDYLHHRPVAAVVYRRRGRAINVFVWRSHPGERLSGEHVRDGHDVIYWTQGGLEFWAVSDISSKELGDFARAYRAAA